MKVIVALGNPGAEYGMTRHNIGWMVVDALAEKLMATRFRRERSVEAAEATVGQEKVYLLKPRTYMNLSGQALSSWLGWMGEIREALREKPEKRGERENVPEGEKIPSPSRQDKADDAECVWPGLLVIADDVNLPLGRMRFRPTGSAGGHNGLSDIEKSLGGRGYPRLRVGVGQPPGQMDRADYVLARFNSAEKPVVEKVTAVAADAVRDWILHDMNTVRNRYNGLTLGGAVAM